MVLKMITINIIEIKKKLYHNKASKYKIKIRMIFIVKKINWT